MIAYSTSINVFKGGQVGNCCGWKAEGNECAAHQKGSSGEEHRWRMESELEAKDNNRNSKAFVNFTAMKLCPQFVTAREEHIKTVASQSKESLFSMTLKMLGILFV
jgi:hypothetical protein